MLVYEMCVGLPPWYTRDRKKLYERLRSAPLEFPAAAAVSPAAESLIRGLLNRDPAKRMGAKRDAHDIMQVLFC
jgi:serum/glucocorticoid-regulated kinase 2